MMATRLASAALDGDANELEHLCMLLCLSVMSGHRGNSASPADKKAFVIRQADVFARARARTR